MSKKLWQQLLDSSLLFIIAYTAFLIIVPNRENFLDLRFAIALGMGLVESAVIVAMFTGGKEFDIFAGNQFLKRLTYYCLISISVALLWRYNYWNYYSFFSVLMALIYFNVVVLNKAMIPGRFFKLIGMGALVVLILLVILIILAFTT